MCDLFFGYFFSPLTFIEARFLNLAQALEAYHRKTRDGMFSETQSYDDLVKDFKAMVDKVPDVDPDLKTKLRNSTEFWPEYTLAKRLTLLLEEFGARFWISSSTHSKTERKARKRRGEGS